MHRNSLGYIRLNHCIVFQLFIEPTVHHTESSEAINGNECGIDVPVCHVKDPADVGSEIQVISERGTSFVVNSKWDARFNLLSGRTWFKCEGNAGNLSVHRCLVTQLEQPCGLFLYSVANTTVGSASTHKLPIVTFL